MKEILYKFILLSYGKVYTGLVKRESSLETAKFSAIMQLSLLFTLNFFAVLFILISFLWEPLSSLFTFAGGRVAVLQVLGCIGGGLIILGVRSLSNRYRDEYENISTSEDSYLKRYVDLYPYLVVVVLMISIYLYATS